MRVLITRELIKQLQTRRGGWTKESLAALGVEWPPKRGWRRELERKIDRGIKIFTRVPDRIEPEY